MNGQVMFTDGDKVTLEYCLNRYLETLREIKPSLLKNSVDDCEKLLEKVRKM